jgi:two-component system chemotaxis response regulator CheY
MDKTRALIVDDSSVMRKIVERSLRQAGIELEKVVEAANGAEALAALQSNVVDLILCDINMPVMDGLEFVRQVAPVETAKGVDIVILGKAWTVTPVAQAAAPVRGPAATPVATKTPKLSPAAVLKPTVVKSVDPRLQP